VRSPQAVPRDSQARMDTREVIVKRTDERTRQSIADAASAIEEDGWEVNRRALAREFSVSPQTVARVLDGPNARRGAEQGRPDRSRSRGGYILAIGFVGFVVWSLRRGFNKS